MKNRIATAAKPTNPVPWLLVTLDDDPEYNAKMAALLEERICYMRWNEGEACTLHGLSRAALQALANQVASFATGRPGFDLTDPSAGLLDALEARAAAAPRPVDPDTELTLQHYCIDLLERQLQRARRRGDPVEISSTTNAIRAHRLRAAKLKRQMADDQDAQQAPTAVERAALDPAFN
ncbi:hypothetical protein ACNQFN_08275 [Thauera butanivorans]|uniref:hypothetical protein n=1 Tax=Thauera butanivorans TaxID=86174 RepID=UPI003AB2A0FF